VRGEHGVIGLGEAAPLAGLSTDTLADAERAIAAFTRCAPFELADPQAAYALAAAASNLVTASPAAASPAARFAIETALLDALAREHAIPLAAILRAQAGQALTIPTSVHAGADPSSGNGGSASIYTGRVPLAAVVDDPEAARRAFAAGIRCLKIKLAATDDPGRVFAIAEAVPGARLRIDANRSWPRAEVAARLAALARLPIDYAEEPCAEAHRLAAEPLSCKIALDESLAAITPDELGAALHGRQLAALVLKPTVLGGLSAVRELAERARRAGVAAIVSHGLEGPVGTAACAELALALGGDHAVGLAGHPALAGWLVGVAQLAPDCVHATAAPGLGLPDLDLAGVVRACGARAIDDGAAQP